MKGLGVAVLACAALALTLTQVSPAAACGAACGTHSAAFTATATPAVGQPAPDFVLPATTGKNISLDQFKGKKAVVLYFYPKNESPGCTKEACDFRDRSAELEKAGVVILAVSNDDLKSHKRFQARERLNFPLLADVDAKVSKLYGVYGSKEQDGKTWKGIQRTTFVIGKDGRIAQVWPKVGVNGHVAEVLDFVAKMEQPGGHDGSPKPGM